MPASIPPVAVSGRFLSLMALVLSLSLLAACATAPAPRANDDASAIRILLQQQSDAWNRGDIDAFMQGYWQDDRLRFASGDSVASGWQTTLERYRAHYPDRAAMGQLSFTDVDIEMVGPDAALVFGRWSLARADDRPHGLFTLLFRRLPDGWRITRDHTSAGQ
jgi:ketosteroid isomerase-like protein